MLIFTLNLTKLHSSLSKLQVLTIISDKAKSKRRINISITLCPRALKYLNSNKVHKFKKIRELRAKNYYIR